MVKHSNIKIISHSLILSGNILKQECEYEKMKSI
jgi:hypothetical protein